MSLSPEERRAAADFLRANTELDMSGLQAALINGNADAYGSSVLAVAQQIPNAALVAGLSGIYANPAQDWADWEPGDVDTASLLSDGGFKRLLDGTGVTLDGIEETTLDRLGSLLAEGALNGDSVDTIALSFMDYLDDSVRAYTIANTELRRASSAASKDMYAENGIKTWDWVLSPDACDLCEDELASNPHSASDADYPPRHPNCRCTNAPNDPGAGASMSTSDEEE